MPGGYKNIKPEDGNGWKPGQSGNPKGRPVSIRKQLKKLLEEDGAITIPAKQVVSVNDDGSVTVSLPTEMQLAMKLKSWAMGKRGSESIKAIQMIMEQIDGKPKQEVENTINTPDIETWAAKFRRPKKS